MTKTPAVLFGVRCNDRTHIWSNGRVFVESASESAMRSLASGSPCNEVVVSRDGGATWVRAGGDG